MPETRPSQWPELFRTALAIFADLKQATGLAPHWTFGGGTALMLQIDHRESHDIDLFLDDPQVLPYLNPETQNYPQVRRPDDYRTDGSSSLKLAYAGIGEIDFIACAAITDSPTTAQEVCGAVARMETPAEIIAKKVYFRGGSFQPRDIFDLAAVVRARGSDYVLTALRACGPDRCARALDTVERAKPDFVAAVIGQLLIRDSCADLVITAQETTRALLREARA